MASGCHLVSLGIMSNVQSSCVVCARFGRGQSTVQFRDRIQGLCSESTIQFRDRIQGPPAEFGICI